MEEIKETEERRKEGEKKKGGKELEAIRKADYFSIIPHGVKKGKKKGGGTTEGRKKKKKRGKSYDRDCIMGLTSSVRPLSLGWGGGGAGRKRKKEKGKNACKGRGRNVISAVLLGRGKTREGKKEKKGGERER